MWWEAVGGFDLIYIIGISGWSFQAGQERKEGDWWGLGVFPAGGCSGDDESPVETLCADGPGVRWGELNRTGSLSQWRQRPGSGPEEWTSWCPPGEADTQVSAGGGPRCCSAQLALKVVLEPRLDVHLVFHRHRSEKGERTQSCVDGEFASVLLFVGRCSP